MLGEPTIEELAIIRDLKAKVKTLEEAVEYRNKTINKLYSDKRILETHIEELEAELEEGNSIGLP